MAVLAITTFRVLSKFGLRDSTILENNTVQTADRTAKREATKQLGVLPASGLIAGESISRVVISAIVLFSGVAAPLALVGGWL